MTKKSEWQIKEEQLNTIRKKGIKTMTKQQMKAVEKAHNVLTDVLTNINQMEDIFLSDIREMNDAMWNLKNEFQLNNVND
jgi:hypothetical protein